MAYTIKRSGGYGNAGDISQRITGANRLISNRILSGRLIGYGGVSIEKINRAGLSEEVLKRLAARRPPVDDSGEADFRFGGPSRFSLVEPEQPTNPKGPSVTVNPGDEEVPEPEDEVTVIDYDEVERTHFKKKIRVENPDDPDQYVMVQDTCAILFVGRKDGVYRRFNFIEQEE